MFGKKRNLILIILIFVGVTIFFVIRTSRNGVQNPFTIKDDAFVISGPSGYSFSIPVDTIDSVDLEQIDDYGKPIEDFSNNRYTCGTFHNDRFGTYKVCAISKIKNCVVISCTDGSVYAFNFENASSTSELHKAILNYLNK